MVSKVSSSPAPSHGKTDTDKKLTDAEKKAKAAADASLKVDKAEKNKIELKPKNVEKITPNVRNSAFLKTFKTHVESEAKPTAVKRIIACAIVATLVFLLAFPWLAPIFVGEALLGLKIAMIIIGGSLTPVGLVIAWKFAFGGMPHQARGEKMLKSLDNDQKLNDYFAEIDRLMFRYVLPPPKNVKNYNADLAYRKAKFAVYADPTLYEFLKDPKNEKRKNVEDASKEVNSLRKRKAESGGAEKKERDEIERDLKSSVDTQRRHEHVIWEEEETILKKHGFVRRM